MTNEAANETKFYEALKVVFTGESIQGRGGFVNLLRIKNAYYEKVLAQFQREVNSCGILQDANAREDFFDHLYSFFSKYFSESGSVYYCKTAYADKKYERVYTDNKDVILFWKTNMLYYVKSDIMYKNIIVEVEQEVQKIKFAFDCSDIQGKQNNEKKEIIFDYIGFDIPKFIDREKSGCHILKVSYSQNGRKTKTDKIAKKAEINEEIIKKAINVFKKQASVDFFINKDAKKFLKEQLDLYIHQVFIDNENEFDERTLKRFKVFKEFAIKLIDFISQFENELVKIWNKPKFVLNSNYVISIDRLNKEIVDKISDSAGLKQQIEEWQTLGIVDENFDFKTRDLSKYAHLPIDTKYFKELEAEILAQFDNLDDALDGRLIHSENYQALNTLKDRYKSQIQCIYIDPPFNTGKDFLFIDNYQESTWLNIIDDRLNIAKLFLREDGNIYLQLDHIEEHLGKILLDKHFGLENYMAKISWNTGDNISGFKSKAKNWIRQSDYIHYYAKSVENYYFVKAYEYNIGKKSEKGSFELGWLDFLGKDKNNLYVEKWKDGRYICEKITGVDVKPKGTIWNDIFSMQYSEPRETESLSFVSNQKPENLLRRIIQTSSEENNYVFDFFSGSGTTCAVSHKLHRKYIGVEAGNYFSETYTDVIELNKQKNKSYADMENSEGEFDDKAKAFDSKSIVEVISETDKKKVIKVRKIGFLGRMKIVINGDKEFKIPTSIRIRTPHLTKDVNWQGGGFFKYYELEQYENTLSKMQYKDSDGIFYNENPFENYVFLTDSKLADVLKFDGKNVSLNFSDLYENIDFAETISLLKGKPIRKIEGKKVILSDGTEYCYDFATMNNEEKIKFAQMLKPLLWWGE